MDGYKPMHRASVFVFSKGLSNDKRVNKILLKSITVKEV